MTCEEIKKVWKDYFELKNEDLREKLIISYIPLVRSIASDLARCIGTDVEYEDLVSEGLIGLIKAIENFDVNKGFKFKTYAAPYIKGTMLIWYNKYKGIPRRVREYQKRIEDAITYLEKENRRTPTNSELAAYLGISEKEVVDMRYAVWRSKTSLLEDYLKYTEDEVINDEIPSDDNIEAEIEKREIIEVMYRMIESLPAKERKIIQLYYFQELTMSDIGKRLQVSKAEVSRTCKKALTKMKVRMDRYVNNIDDNLPVIETIFTSSNSEVYYNAYKEALKSLNERERDLINSHYVREIPLKELCDVFGKSQVTMSIFHRATLNKLKVEIDKYLSGLSGLVYNVNSKVLCLPWDIVKSKEFSEVFNKTFNSLSEYEKALLIYHYQDGIELKELAKRFKRTYSSISRFHRETMKKLKSYMDVAQFVLN